MHRWKVSLILSTDEGKHPKHQEQRAPQWLHARCCCLSLFTLFFLPSILTLTTTKRVTTCGQDWTNQRERERHACSILFDTRRHGEETRPRLHTPPHAHPQKPRNQTFPKPNFTWKKNHVPFYNYVHYFNFRRILDDIPEKKTKKTSKHRNALGSVRSPCAEQTISWSTSW